MKTYPILFNGEMVRAILEGRKTQTRRVCDIVWDTSKYWGNYDCWTFRKGGKPFIGFSTSNNGQGVVAHHCPYGQPGDSLWVRETWRPAFDTELHCCVEYRADGALVKPKSGSLTEDQGHRFADDCPDDADLHMKWRPSIHMPRWARRITLEITGVRVERVADTSEDDAKAEGCWPLYRHPIADPRGRFPNKDTRSYRSDFMNLWDSIYMDQGLGLEANPWVWVVEFKRVVS